ncbi:ABC transporter ATP-binding protein [Anaerococcus sp. Marseille-P3625]|uniref:ABC transporter ATP-binding protein n=1 Tax=Anaerococcus sp. Marseille-P3625 TaxID=1977277 RepID=UPI000C0813DB|nr:ABC transporter ATP-binding protein [Anaerococcus sp. Marseille-P3625]
MKNLFKILKLMNEKNKGFLLKAISFSLILGILPLYNIIAPKLVIDEFNGARRFSIMLLIVLGVLLINFISSEINFYSRFYYMKIFQNFIFELQFMVNEKVLRLPIELTDSKSIQNKVEQASESIWYVYSLFDVFTMVVGALITGIISIIILIRLNIFVPFLIFGLFLLNIPLAKKIKKNEVSYTEKSAIESRIYRYYMYFSKDFKYSKDLKIYKGEKLILDKAAFHLNQMYKVNHKYFTSNGAYLGLMNLINNSGVIVSFIYLSFRLIENTLSIANFTLYFNSLIRLIDGLNILQQNAANVMGANTILEVLFEFLAIKEDENTENGIKDIDLSKVKIEFKDVSFKYPTSEDYILKDCSFVINPGETLALVGRNGAGKSTIVKLLCRFYDVSSGEILLNGINIENIDKNYYYQILSPTFQDFRLFPFRIDENVATIGHEEITDKDYEEMDRSFRLLNIKNWVDSLTKKKANYITSLFDDKGIEPSGGLGQKLALSRSMYHKGKFIIMDEPTSALDPRSEQEIFENMLEITKDQTSLFISHRLSSTKYADRILVCNNHCIEDTGTHDELMKKNKLYKEMFETQAELYT